MKRIFIKCDFSLRATDSGLVAEARKPLLSNNETILLICYAFKNFNLHDFRRKDRNSKLNYRKDSRKLIRSQLFPEQNFYFLLPFRNKKFFVTYSMNIFAIYKNNMTPFYPLIMVHPLNQRLRTLKCFLLNNPTYYDVRIFVQYVNRMNMTNTLSYRHFLRKI